MMRKKKDEIASRIEKSEMWQDIESPDCITIGDISIDISNEYDSPIYSLGFVKAHRFGDRKRMLEDVERFSELHQSLLYIVSQKEKYLTPIVAEEHYVEHKDKPFFPDLIKMSTEEGPVYMFIVQGTDAIRTLRNIAGATDPRQATENTIRRKYGQPELGKAYNAMHASDSLRSFIRETELYYSRGEILELGEQFWKRFDVYKSWAYSEKNPKK